MNRIIKFVFILLVFLILSCMWIVYKAGVPKVYIIHLDHNVPISQEIALDVTRQVLNKAGIDVEKMMPQHYKADNLFKPNEIERWFSRDPQDPNNSGYIIWKGIDGATYKVDIKRLTDKIKCEITLIYAPPKLALLDC